MKYKSIFATIAILGALWGIMNFYLAKDFPIFVNRQHQEKQKNNIPDIHSTKIFTAGHLSLYGVFRWIDLIQGIANPQTEISNHIKNIDYITQIIPDFELPYEWALIVLPIPQNLYEELHQKDQKNIESGLKIAYKGMQRFCDAKKIETISKTPNTQNLWKNTALQNPCKNPDLPYKIAFYEGTILGDNKKAEEFYKITSLHDDAPPGAKILSLLSSGGNHEPHIIAQNFLLTAQQDTSIQDTKCQELSLAIFEKVHNNRLTSDDIDTIQQLQKTLKKPLNTKGYSCYDFLDRGIKYTFLTFINEKSKSFPQIKNIEELLPKIGLKSVPLTATQSNLTLTKINNLWQYSEK